MSIWIKICGLTTEDAVAAAVDAGADAVGFVFAASKRQVSAQRAAQITVAMPRRVVRVAVMQHPPQSQLDEVWSVFRPDVLQTDAEDIAQLRVPAQLDVMPVIRAGRPHPSPPPRRLLFEGPMSGTGVIADWDVAAQLSCATQLILAGGLTAQNVASAIARVRPFGVDVSSGVEAAPGIKDPARIYEFVRNARAAVTETSP